MGNHSSSALRATTGSIASARRAGKRQAAAARAGAGTRADGGLWLATLVMAAATLYSLAALVGGR